MVWLPGRSCRWAWYLLVVQPRPPGRVCGGLFSSSSSKNNKITVGIWYTILRIFLPLCSNARNDVRSACHTSRCASLMIFALINVRDNGSRGCRASHRALDPCSSHPTHQHSYPKSKIQNPRGSCARVAGVSVLGTTSCEVRSACRAAAAPSRATRPYASVRTTRTIHQAHTEPAPRQLFRTTTHRRAPAFLPALSEGMRCDGRNAM